ncbi:MAG: thioredoxin domain-containing protein [Gemmatimonadaceae bacterium]
MVTPGSAPRSNRPFYGALLVIAIGGAGVLSFLATRPKSQAVTTTDRALPPAKAEGYLLGRADAPVQIVEFADFQCPACGTFATVTEPDVRTRIVDAGLASYRFFDFPLPQHGNAMKASLAAACANEQGKFWEMHDALFQGQPDWSDQRNPKSTFAGYAKQMHIDAGRWEECYDSRRYERQVIANRTEGERRAIDQTPTFVVGNKVMKGVTTYDLLKAYVDSAVARTKSAPTSAR